jgi:hypothetical protein
MTIHATPLLVAQTLNARMEFALVCPNTRVIRTVAVDQSVSLTMTVLETKLA